MLLQQYIYIAFSICRLDLVFLKKRQIFTFVELSDVAFVYGAFNPHYILVVNTISIKGTGAQKQRT